MTQVPEGAEVARPPGRLLLGLVLVAGVLIVSLHFAEVEQFVGMAERAAPAWLLLALLLQVATYPAQGAIWQRMARAAGTPLSLGTASRLTLAKLFVDQTVPSAGVGGSLVLAGALERRGLARPAAAAAMVVYTVSNQLAFALALGLGLTLVGARGHTVHTLVLGSVATLFFALALAGGVLVLSGRPRGRVGLALARVPLLRPILGELADADPALARRGPLVLEAAGYQLLTIALDSVTLWALLRAVGEAATVPAAFIGLSLSNVFRLVGILPGGLGAFEAASIVALRIAGVPLAPALSATMLFRLLSFWLPMAPGWWVARAALLRREPVPDPAPGYWGLTPLEVMRRLECDDRGLATEAATARLARFGPNTLRAQRPLTRRRVFLSQLESPLLLLLVVAAGVALLTREWLDATIVLVIVAATVGIGYSREYSAQSAAAALQARLSTRAQVLRDGRPRPVPITEVVPGDSVLLSAGSLVPGDGLILEATDLYVSEAVLTGESFPVRKAPGTSPPGAPVARRTNCVFLGTNVRSGTARCLVVRTGAATEFGHIASRLARRRPDTEFERGTRRFGYLLTIAMLVLVLVVFVAHVMEGRPPAETLLFALALAVGLSPELLPAILGINLARGARMMAGSGVLVRRLNAIENLGSMDVLCTDKTGTLTEGVVELEGAFDAAGRPAADALEQAALNAALETGLANPLDDAILARHRPDLARVRKLAEVPFDFLRRRVSVVVEGSGGATLLTKGAVAEMLAVCATTGDGQPLDAAALARIRQLVDAWHGRGVRVLAVASRGLPPRRTYGREDERDLVLQGFLTFLDRPKEGAGEAIAALRRLGVTVKLITGDNRRVARYVAEMVGMPVDQVCSGEDLDRLNDEALWHSAERTQVFAEVDPNQKERIIQALRRTGHVVGFLGDGVNDAPAMYAADTSLSVDQAVDVAREAADFVLLERDLDVIRRGIEEGRRTFANTLKYVQTTTSANLGNMISMAFASLFLPFLPLLPGQVLLNNFLSDIPAIGIADDHVDSEQVERPRRWDIRMIGRFMVQFGLLSALFDFLTFGLLLHVVRAGAEVFRTAWFVESLLTELVIALVVRTRRPFYRSRPGRLLWVATAVLVPVAFAIPYLPLTGLLGFVPLSGRVVLMVAGITLAYVAATEVQKRVFYRSPAIGR